MLALLVFAALITGNIYNRYNEVNASEQARLLSQVRVIANNLEHQLKVINKSLENARNELSSSKRSNSQQPSSPHLKTLVDAIPGILFINVLDADGTEIFSSGDLYVGKNFSHREYFKRVKEAPDPRILYVSPPYKGLRGGYLMNVSRMIPGKNGEFAGIITAALNPDYFNILMTSVIYAPDADTGLIHGDGILFLLIPKHVNLEGKNLATPGSFFSRHRDSGKRETVVTGIAPSSKKKRMVARLTLQPDTLRMDKPLYISMSRNQDAILASWRQESLIQSGLYLLLALFSIISLYVYQRHQHQYEKMMLEQVLASHTEKLQKLIGHELHDNLGQILTGISFLSKSLEQKLINDKSPNAELATSIVQNTKRAAIECKNLTIGLSPLELESNDLESSIKALAKRIEHIFNITCQVENYSVVPIDDINVAQNLYRVVQEAVSNAIRHGKATVLMIRIFNDVNEFRLSVCDNGTGFLLTEDDAPSSTGMGLKTMAYRASQIGATVRYAQLEGGGLEVVVEGKRLNSKHA